MGKQYKILKNIFKTSYQQAAGNNNKQTWLYQLREKRENKQLPKSNTHSKQQKTSANEDHGTSPELGKKPLGRKP